MIDAIVINLQSILKLYKRRTDPGKRIPVIEAGIKDCIKRLKRLLDEENQVMVEIKSDDLVEVNILSKPEFIDVMVILNEDNIDIEYEREFDEFDVDDDIFYTDIEIL